VSETLNLSNENWIINFRFNSFLAQQEFN
jgi:hypothetical protein